MQWFPPNWLLPSKINRRTTLQQKSPPGLYFALPVILSPPAIKNTRIFQTISENRPENRFRNAVIRFRRPCRLLKWKQQLRASNI